MVTWENCEEYIMMYADGELAPAEELALTKFIDQHPELKSEVALYNTARCSPDEQLVYAHKQQLIKAAPGKWIIALPVWPRYGIAAAAAALIFVFLLRWEEKQSLQTTTVTQAKPANIPASHLRLPVAKTSSAVQQIVASTAVPAKINLSQTRTQLKNTNNRMRPVLVKRSPADDDAIAPVNLRVRAKTEIAALPLGVIKKMNVTPGYDTASALPETSIAINAKKEKNQFLQELPLDDANRGQVKTIKRVFAAARKQLKKINIHLDQESVALNF